MNFLAKEEMSGVTQQQSNVHEGKINFLGNSNTWEESRETLIWSIISVKEGLHYFY